MASGSRSYELAPGQEQPIDEGQFFAHVSVGGLKRAILSRRIRQAQRAAQQYKDARTVSGASYGVHHRPIGGLSGLLTESRGILPIPRRVEDHLAERAGAKSVPPRAVRRAAQQVRRAERPLERAYGGALPRQQKPPKVKPQTPVHLSADYWTGIEQERQQAVWLATQRAEAQHQEQRESRKEATGHTKRGADAMQTVAEQLSALLTHLRDQQQPNQPPTEQKNRYTITTEPGPHEAGQGKPLPN